MTQSKLQGRVTNLLVVGKLVIIAYLFIQFLAKGFDIQQVIDTLSIIVPLFTVHLTLIIKYYFDDLEKAEEKAEGEEKEKEPELKRPVVISSQLIPWAYILYLFIIITLKPMHWGVVSDGETSKDLFPIFKNLLGLGETMFGVYLGQVIAAMFKQK